MNMLMLETHQVTNFIKNNNAKYFDSFGVNVFQNVLKKSYVTKD